MRNKGSCLLLRNRNILCLRYSWRNQVIYFQSSLIGYSDRAKVCPLSFSALWDMYVPGGFSLDASLPQLSSTLQTSLLFLMYCLKMCQSKVCINCVREGVHYSFSSGAGPWVFSLPVSQWSPYEWSIAFSLFPELHVMFDVFDSHLHFEESRKVFHPLPQTHILFLPLFFLSSHLIWSQGERQKHWCFVKSEGLFSWY